MKLDAGAIGIAAGVTAAIVSVTGALIVAVAPEFATNLFSNVIHLDLTPLVRKVTWGNALGGLVFWGVGTAVVFASGAWVYTRTTGSGTA